MRQGMASCTGLSILLVDALRSVGIPARFAGTASWHDDRGNHSWTEVRLDDGWHFTEFYQLGPRPRLVPGRCRAGCAGRAEICDLCRFVPPHGRLVPDGLE